MDKQQLINQQTIVAEGLKSAGDKHAIMEYLAMVGQDFHPTMLGQEYLIAGCISRTVFRVSFDQDGFIHIAGDSQSMIMKGVISLMADALNDYDAETIKEVGITWVDSVGLMDMLTPQRQGAIRQMAERIYRACDQWLQKQS
ncbi:MAG: SufE family protein [Paludibacteraceae bacterium]|nr:SufE family protein [Paludibacteraceae bacterium]